MSYQIPEDASSWTCAPSIGVRNRSTLAGLGAESPLVSTTNLMFADVTALLNRGYAVSIPDYEGPRSLFGAPRAPGYAVLDGIRAAQTLDSLGLPGRTTPSVAWGYSGGSLPTAWAAEVQPQYAPRMRFEGAAFGGYLASLEGAYRTTNKTYGAGLILSTLPGVLRSDPELRSILSDYLTAEGRTALDVSASRCAFENIEGHPMRDLSTYLTISWQEFLSLPDVRARLKWHDPAKNVPKAPMYVYHAVNDELVPIVDADAAVHSYCAGQATVQYERLLIGDHISAEFSGSPAAIAWITARVDAEPSPSNC